MGLYEPARPREEVMSAATLRRAVLVLLACAAAGVRRPRPVPSPVRALPREAIPNDPVPGERYYVLVFGSERAVRVPRFTHTWATVVKTVEVQGCAPQVAEVHTISWMPASLEIHPWRFTPEPGRNLELHETVRMALGNREHVAMWGPYEIQPQLYRRFLLQKAFMESGRVGYQCIDTLGEGADGSGCDCIHAITDMDPEFDRGLLPVEPVRRGRQPVHRPATVRAGPARQRGDAHLARKPARAVPVPDPPPGLSGSTAPVRQPGRSQDPLTGWTVNLRGWGNVGELA